MGRRRAGYDRIGTTYTATRATDPVIAAVIREAIGDARTVINVGAGTGSYEPDDLDVTAVEPSATMIAQRSAAAAPVVQASADALPFADHSFDVAMAIMSDHHWDRRLEGLAELRRVAERIVLVNAAPAAADAFWLTRDYLTGFRDLIPLRYRPSGVWEAELDEVLGDVEVRVLPVPAHCYDGFYSAFWRRPAAYLDPGVRAGISVFDRLPSAHVDSAVATLDQDLKTGAWFERNQQLVNAASCDCGMRIVTSGHGP